MNLTNVFLVMALGLLAVAGVEFAQIAYLKGKIVKLTDVNADYEQRVTQQNVAMAAYKAASDRQVQVVLKARSDAMLEAKKNATQLLKLSQESIGKTCAEAMHYGYQKSQQLYRCYEVNCTSKS